MKIALTSIAILMTVSSVLSQDAYNDELGPVCYWDADCDNFGCCSNDHCVPGNVCRKLRGYPKENFQTCYVNNDCKSDCCHNNFCSLGDTCDSSDTAIPMGIFIAIIALIVIALAFFFVKDVIIFRKLKRNNQLSTNQKKNRRNSNLYIGTSLMNDRINPDENDNGRQLLERAYLSKESKTLDDEEQKLEHQHYEENSLKNKASNNRSGADNLRDELNSSINSSHSSELNDSRSSNRSSNSQKRNRQSLRRELGYEDNNQDDVNVLQNEDYKYTQRQKRKANLNNNNILDELDDDDNQNANKRLLPKAPQLMFDE
eukprot:403362719